MTGNSLASSYSASSLSRDRRINMPIIIKKINNAFFVTQNAVVKYATKQLKKSCKPSSLSRGFAL